MSAPPEAALPEGVLAYPPRFTESRLLDEANLARSIDATLGLAEWDGVSDLWLFGYGSLIWNPGMPVLEARRSVVYGHHRGLYLWSRVNRGTLQRPGLVLALDRGGSCCGIALRLAGDGARGHLETLWRREMPMGSYRPMWLRCALDDGRRVAALAFVIRRDASGYAGRLPDEVLRAVFSCASGRYGSTRDYVLRTADALRTNGMPDPGLEALIERCAVRGLTGP